MGNLKTVWLIGFEWWGGLKPAMAWDKKGRCFTPLVFGIWIRRPAKDKKI